MPGGSHRDDDHAHQQHNDDRSDHRHATVVPRRAVATARWARVPRHRPRRGRDGRTHHRRRQIRGRRDPCIGRSGVGLRRISSTGSEPSTYPSRTKYVGRPAEKYRDWCLPNGSGCQPCCSSVTQPSAPDAQLDENGGSCTSDAMREPANSSTLHPAFTTRQRNVAGRVDFAASRSS